MGNELLSKLSTQEQRLLARVIRKIDERRAYWRNIAESCNGLDIKQLEIIRHEAWMCRSLVCHEFGLSKADADVLAARYADIQLVPGP